MVQEIFDIIFSFYIPGGNGIAGPVLHQVIKGGGLLEKTQGRGNRTLYPSWRSFTRSSTPPSTN